MFCGFLRLDLRWIAMVPPSNSKSGTEGFPADFIEQIVFATQSDDDGADKLAVFFLV
jgi:hypothetical protein